ncbi:MAG: TlpA family protein disulfide reductase [Nocardioidaceae bacterium]
MRPCSDPGGRSHPSSRRRGGPCGHLDRARGSPFAASRQLSQTVFLGINTREPKSKAEAFVRANSIPYDSIYDPDSNVMLSFYSMLTPQSLPSTVVIDPQGRIAALVLGEVTENTLVGIVDDVAAEV